MAHMQPQYDAIGNRYDRWKETPVPRYAEVPTVERLLTGLVEGLTVLDLACGTGFYSRLLRRLGASRVVGVDISGTMIAAAQEEELREKVGLEFRVADATELPVLDRFDLATAMYLLHYAETPEIMSRMCRNIAANLAPEGRLVALLPDPDYVVGKEETARYGFDIHATESGEDWILLRADIHTTPSFSIEYRQWTKRTYEHALAAAGFGDIRWHPLEISREGISRFGAPYWRPFLDNPLSIALTARSAGVGPETAKGGRA